MKTVPAGVVPAALPRRIHARRALPTIQRGMRRGATAACAGTHGHGADAARREHGLGVRYTVVPVSAKNQHEPERRDEGVHDLRRILTVAVIAAIVVGMCVPMVLSGL